MTVLVKIHHILSGKVANINSNIIRYFSTHCREMGTEHEAHLFHVFQDKSQLSAEELRFFNGLPVDVGRLNFDRPGKGRILRMLLRVGRGDLILVHSGRMSSFFLMLLVTPWLWKKTALICFGGEVKIWERLRAARGLKSRVLWLSLRVVVPRIRAVCTLTPGEYAFIRGLFGEADNYERVFMTSSRRVGPEVLEVRARATSPMVRVLLNQSANPGGRHVEALDWLRKFRDEDIQITCPVSFGDRQEAEAIIRAGKDRFGGKFRFLKEKLPYDEYSRMINSEMDILVLNHLGQAGLGHLYMFLSMGKPAYIRRESPVFALLKDIDIEVRETNAIPEMSFEEFSGPLTLGFAEKNIRNFNSHLSTEASVESCRRLFQLMRQAHE